MSTSLSPADEQYVRQVLAVYEEAERQIIARIATLVGRGNMDAADWAERKRTEFVLERRRLQAVLAAANAKAARLSEEALAAAYADAAKAAGSAAVRIGGAAPALLGVANSRAINNLVAQATGQLAARHQLVIARASTAFNDAVNAAVGQTLTGSITRQQAAQSVLTQFAERGITGYITASRRSLSLASAVETATRSVTMRARINGQTDRLVEHGHDLVIVSDSPAECETCAPWEGEILSLTGRVAGYPTLADAEADGLHHPNCTHSLSAYFPGVTNRKPVTRNPEAYAARQKLRYHESQVRAGLRREAAAMDSAALTRAQALTANRRAALRAHVDATGAKRQPHRERLGAL